MTAWFPDLPAKIDCEVEVQRICAETRRIVSSELHRRGAIVAVSGGVDSAVCAALAARALGPTKVLGLLLPERDVSGDATRLGVAVCEAVGIAYQTQDLSASLEALGCYERRDRAIRTLVPEYGAAYKQKISVASGILERDRISYFNLEVEAPDGQRTKKRMPVEVYLEIVAATNMKQRTRKLIEYYHAERLNYAVIGTPNRLEYDLGFFVRGGDGLADLKIIAHLYKTQVYALAKYLGLPEEVVAQTPSTGTYSLAQTQEEFYFALPYQAMDRLLCAFHCGVPPETAAGPLELRCDQVERLYRDIKAKQAAARLHLQPGIVLAGE
jgi:NAD+ synthase